MAPSQVYRVARLLIERHEDEAVLFVITRLYELADAGDEAGFSTWLRVLDAAEELQSAGCGACKVLH